MAFKYLRTDADLEAGRSVPAVLARETVRCAADMALAARRGRGVSKVSAPYWMARRFLGMAGTPLDSDEVVRFRFDTPGRPAEVCVRINQSDMFIIWEVFLNRIYDVPLPGVRPGTATIIDAGGNSGITAAYFSARYSPRTLVTIEPLAENLAVLNRNAELSEHPWRIEEVALASSPRTLEFFVSGNWASCTAVEAIGQSRHSKTHRLENALERPKVTVQATTMEALFEKHSIDHVDLMKMDIEGGEYDLLVGDPAWLRKVDHIILEVHDKYIDGAAVRRALDSAGFERRPQAGPGELYTRGR